MKTKTITMNVAFWDHTKRRLVDYERVSLDHDGVTVSSICLSMIWQSRQFGPHDLPTPYWLAWPEDDPTAEDLRLFFLHGYPDFPESVMDEIRAAAVAAACLARAH